MSMCPTCRGLVMPQDRPFGWGGAICYCNLKTPAPAWRSPVEEQARREMTGNMPTGENRLAGRQYEVEDRPNESDWEQDAWIEIRTGSQLEQIMREWARIPKNS